MGKRIEYLDYCKGLAILLVVVGHIIPGYNFFKSWFCTFHMPIFFIISGIFISKSFIEKGKMEYSIKKYAKSLLIPYVTFSIINIINLASMAFLNNESVIDVSKDKFKALLLLKGVKVTWFLTCLFIAIFIFYFLYNTFKNKKLFILSIAILFIIPFIDINIINISSKIVLFRAFIATALITMGFYLYPHLNKISTSWITIISINLLNVIYWRLLGTVDLSYLKINDPILYAGCGFLGSLGIILFFKKIQESNINLSFLGYLGKNSLIILGTHMLMVSHLKYVLIEYILKSESVFNNNLIIYVPIILILTVLIDLIFIEVLNRYLPKLIGKNKEVMVK